MLQDVKIVQTCNGYGIVGVKTNVSLILPPIQQSCTGQTPKPRDDEASTLFPLTGTTCEDESHGGRGVRDQNHLGGLLDFLWVVQFKI